MSNPDSPAESATYPTTYTAGNVKVSGGTVYIVHPHGGVSLYYGDTNSNSVSIDTDILGASNAESAVVSGNYAFAPQFYSADNESLISIDISDPANAKVAGYLPIADQPNRITGVNGGVVLGMTTNEFWTVDTSDPTNMSIGVKTNTVDAITGMTSTPDLLVIANHAPNIEIYNFPTNLNPSLLKVASVAERLYSMTINGTALYAAGDSNLYVFSLSTPSNPTEQDTFALPNWASRCKFKEIICIA